MGPLRRTSERTSDEASAHRMPSLHAGHRRFPLVALTRLGAVYSWGGDNQGQVATAAAPRTAPTASATPVRLHGVSLISATMPVAHSAG